MMYNHTAVIHKVDLYFKNIQNYTNTDVYLHLPKFHPGPLSEFLVYSAIFLSEKVKPIQLLRGCCLLKKHFPEKSLAALASRQFPDFSCKIL